MEKIKNYQLKELNKYDLIEISDYKKIQPFISREIKPLGVSSDGMLCYMSDGSYSFRVDDSLLTIGNIKGTRVRIVTYTDLQYIDSDKLEDTLDRVLSIVGFSKQENHVYKLDDCTVKFLNHTLYISSMVNNTSCTREMELAVKVMSMKDIYNAFNYVGKDLNGYKLEISYSIEKDEKLNIKELKELVEKECNSLSDEQFEKFLEKHQDLIHENTEKWSSAEWEGALRLFKNFRREILEEMIKQKTIEIDKLEKSKELLIKEYDEI